jgi:hypothetical protein
LLHLVTFGYILAIRWEFAIMVFLDMATRFAVRRAT